MRSLQLNENLQPVGVAMNVLVDTEIYEFDADIVGDIIFLFATTAQGYVVATSNQTMQ